MKIGFNEATTMKRSTLALDLELADRHGYDLIEIRLDKLKQYLSEHDIGELAAFFDDHYLKPYTFNALEFITFRDKAGYSQIKSDLDLLCTAGKKVGCDTIIVVPTFDIVDKTIREIRRESISVLNDLADTAERHDIRLAYEFVGYPNCSVNTFGQCYEIIHELNRDSVGLVLDCFHFHVMNSRWEDLEQADAKKIFVLHVDDSEDLPPGILRDQHRLWPGDGVVPLDRILRILRKNGYDGAASVELFRPEYWNWDVEQAIRVGKEKTLKVLAEVY
ncbi:isomerase [Anaerosporomusa subterranea]|uniref:Isomerase n=1 Tax=Anaerosporomusa subterranea TaxID=1794912 RepID=A0A154BSV4_ANASB|nr:sugar phosphate isomerase/epimerase [Anaerosporomusa subterranea]KYZ76598.1 isomerase [Anaerosporomusa subterranea]